jgi:hypothetical protein
VPYLRRKTEREKRGDVKEGKDGRKKEEGWKEGRREERKEGKRKDKKKESSLCYMSSAFCLL